MRCFFTLRFLQEFAPQAVRVLAEDHFFGRRQHDQPSRSIRSPTAAAPGRKALVSEKSLWVVQQRFDIFRVHAEINILQRRR
jgi:hypothetical protein